MFGNAENIFYSLYYFQLQERDDASIYFYGQYFVYLESCKQVPTLVQKGKEQTKIMKKKEKK